MSRRALTVGVVAVMVTGCASVPVRCPVAGERATLAGMWQGEFISSNSDRTGSIRFELRQGQDSAYGDVALAEEQWANAVRLSGDQRVRSAAMPEVIRIRFVYVASNEVRGTLEDYTDPGCGCTLRTIFRGELTGDLIEGTYETRFSRGGLAASGTWAVRRSAELDTRVESGQPVR